jgi:hypothetical protein
MPLLFLALLVWFLLLVCQRNGWGQRIETQTPPLPSKNA